MMRHSNRLPVRHVFGRAGSDVARDAQKTVIPESARAPVRGGFLG